MFRSHNNTRTRTARCQERDATTSNRTHCHLTEQAMQACSCLTLIASDMTRRYAAARMETNVRWRGCFHCSNVSRVTVECRLRGELTNAAVLQSSSQ
jgi:hypothetical protein